MADASTSTRPVPRRHLLASLWAVVCWACVLYTAYSCVAYLLNKYLFTPDVTSEKLLSLRPMMTYPELCDLFNATPNHRILGPNPPRRTEQVENAIYVWEKNPLGAMCVFEGGKVVKMQILTGKPVPAQ